MIIPEWVDGIPDFVDPTQTNIVLYLKPEIRNEINRYLEEIHPSLLLFLRKLKVIEVEEKDENKVKRMEADEKDGTVEVIYNERKSYWKVIKKVSIHLFQVNLLRIYSFPAVKKSLFWIFIVPITLIMMSRFLAPSVVLKHPHIFLCRTHSLKARSAALFVGSTPGTSMKVKSSCAYFSARFASVFTA